MRENHSLEPEDLMVAARLSHDALTPVADHDWNIPAYELEWSCRHTAGHISRALLSYSIHLANRARARLPYASSDDPQLSITQLIAVVRAMTGVLLEVVKAAPAGVRAWHPWGMADVSGFIAMGCSEILIHTSDITQAFNAAFDPPDDLCERVARRLFPWAPGNVDGWPALRWGNGRVALPGHERLGPDWGWHCAPLNEWDGTIEKEST